METMLRRAHTLVYSLINLIPSVYQKASLKAMLGLSLAYQRAIQLNPNFVLAYRNLGNLYASQQQLQKAEHCFT